MWQNGAGQALELCAALGKVYGMPGLSFDAGKDLTMDWGDGVLFDRTRTWNEYMSMVTSGLLRPELALAWYFDLPHADAAQLAKIRKDLMPQTATSCPRDQRKKERRNPDWSINRQPPLHSRCSPHPMPPGPAVPRC